MTRSPRALPFVLVLALAACAEGASITEEATAEPTPSASPSASASTDPTPSPPTPASEPAEASPSATPIEGEGGFTYEASAEADALMLDRFDCQNLDDGYQVDFPAEWNTNAELGSVPTCSWFAPIEYETGASGSVPDEVAIEIFVVDGAPEFLLQIIDERSGFIGATQPATRVRMTGNDADVYEYVIQLGPTLEEGPNLVARTSSLMGGDYDLNRAILDRMMATMEFIGVIQ
jgi:hypothetical protein